LLQASRAEETVALGFVLVVIAFIGRRPAVSLATHEPANLESGQEDAETEAR